MQPTTVQTNWKVFLIFVLGDVCAVGGLYIIYGYVPNNKSGIAPAALLALLGMGSTCGRLFFTLLFNNQTPSPSVKPLVLMSLVIGAAAIMPLLFALPSPTNSIVLALVLTLSLLPFSYILGGLTGIWISGSSTILANLLEEPKQSTGFALLTCLRGIVALLIPIGTLKLAKIKVIPSLLCFISSGLFGLSALLFAMANFFYN